MKNLLEFDPKRFWHLLKLEFTTKNKRTVYVLAGILAAVVLLQLIAALDGDRDGLTIFHELFGVLLIGGGLIYTSYSFNEFTETTTGMTYLTLPASNLEKFTSKWLFSTVGYYLFFIIIFTIFCWLGSVLSELFFSVPAQIVHPFSPDALLLAKVYFVVSSVFFLGAITFNVYPAPKTILSVLGTGLVVAFIALLVIRLVFFDFFDGFEPIEPEGFSIGPQDDEIKNFVEGPLTTGGKFLFWIALPLLLWAVSFFKLKEKQIG